MKLTRVKRVLTKRLAYLAAKIESGTSPVLAEEHDALETALRCLRMLDAERVEEKTVRCREVVLPAEQRMKERARRGDELRDDVGELVVALMRAGRAA